MDCPKKNIASLLTSLNHINVAVALPIYNTFTYHVPQPLKPCVREGKRVLVPFGKRRITGYVFGYCDKGRIKKIKSILDVIDEVPLFPSSMIPFFKWIADYYKHPIGEVIKGALPSGINSYDIDEFTITKDGKRVMASDSPNPMERRILESLMSRSYNKKQLGKLIGQDMPQALIQILSRNGWIKNNKRLRVGKTRPKAVQFVSLGSVKLPDKKLSPQRKKIIHTLESQGEMSVKRLETHVPSARRIIKPMKEAGYVSIYKKGVYRDPFGASIEPDVPPELNKDQKGVIAQIVPLLCKGYTTCLLTGVTGSGKTEVYMNLALKTLEKGSFVLILVPEIALISQIERRFRARFGECVALLHSGLSSGERYDQWMRIVNGSATIAIGARSAVFAPFPKIGLIIVDEEHDGSYKQEGGFYYNARDLSILRARFMNCVAFLGSATPSMQSYHNGVTDKFLHLTLKNRVKELPLPEVTVIDLRKKGAKKNPKPFISHELYIAIKETLIRKQQVLLFLNRRGFANFPVCSACGEAIRCRNCDISLTLHHGANAYLCHYCGFSRPGTSKCPSCGEFKIKLLGVGTEKLELMIKGLFPKAAIDRLDQDTTKKKGSLLQILKRVKDEETDILIGTQMAAKGHDFPNITLVGIICADLSLSFPDFRAGERTYQLLAQVAGRAGRGTVPGKVILQTFTPDHFVIKTAREQHVKAFYDHEISFRRALNYPPFSRMVQLKISGKDRKKTKQHVTLIGDLCHQILKESPDFLKGVVILGPIESSIARIANRYRWQILLKGSNTTILHRFVHRLIFDHKVVLSYNPVKVAVDVDPFFMM